MHLPPPSENQEELSAEEKRALEEYEKMLKARSEAAQGDKPREPYRSPDDPEVLNGLHCLSGGSAILRCTAVQGCPFATR